MIKNAMSLKAKINNIAKKDKVLPQAVMHTYMLERLLERISISEYKDNFILKGGMLISSIIGIDNRSTMDMDTTNDKNVVEDVINFIQNDNSLKEQWNKYQHSYEYAKDIKYEQLIHSISSIKELYF